MNNQPVTSPAGTGTGAGAGASDGGGSATDGAPTS